MQSDVLYDSPATLSIPGVTDLYSLENRKRAQEGVKVLNNITKKPLNRCWAYFSEIYPIILYLINLIVTLMSTIQNPHPMSFKIPYVILSFVENIMLWTVSGIFFFKEKTEKNEKYKQYIENITHELLIYPVIVVTVIAFSTEKSYVTPTTPVQWIALLILIFDAVDLLKTTANRLYMTCRAIADIKKVVCIQQKCFKITCLLRRI